MLEFRLKHRFERWGALMARSESQTGDEVYEFGPFRVEAARERLLKNGESIPLTPKNFQILLVLLRHGNEVVTKDDLMKAVWPDTFVEEANLSRNIFMLRKALGETAQDHLYVVTVPGRGYRLTEVVTLLPSPELTIADTRELEVQVQVKRRRMWLWIFAAAVLLLAASVGIWRWTSHRRALLSEKDSVVLADFTNSTGDAVFDQTLRRGMAVQLEQSPFLNLISDERIQHTLHLMGRSGGEQLTPDLARDICERIGSSAVLEGSLAMLGNRYVLGLRAVSCSTGRLLDEEQVQVSKKEDVLDALSRIATTYRTRVGESLATIHEHNTPLAEATTPSLEALKSYSAAWKSLFSSGSAASLPLFQQATEIDPQFAMAYGMVGRMYADMGESVLSAKNTARAYDLRDRASEREKLFISASYELQVTGNLEKAQEVCELWARTYPRDPIPHGLLATLVVASGQFEKSVKEARRSIELDPDFAFGYVNLGASLLYLNRLDDAEKSVQQVSGPMLELPETLILNYQIAFLKDDRTAMARIAESGRGQLGAEDWLVGEAAYAQAFHGHLLQARSLSRHATELALQSGQRERAAQHEIGAAVWEALLGNAKEARENAGAALQLSTGRDVEYGAALAMAMSGESQQYQALAEELQNRFPSDSLVKFSYMPTLRALMALNHQNPSKAVEELQLTGPYDLGWPGSNSVGFVGALYPVYVRGEAYLAEKRGVEAAAEFRKILDSRGVVLSDPIGVLAHLQLARALLLSGEKAKSKNAYNEFFDRWKEAEPDIPILRSARAESAGLK
jgi:DNA-binding winged helix-turn-helix (wHTH) protein/tetratricopeptide (TPR) repeat protein